MDKTILIIMGISIPVAIVVVIYAIMSVQTANEVNDIFNTHKLLKDLDDGKITILQYYEHKVSEEQQKLCTDHKNRFGIKWLGLD